ncbi:MAG: hypothetical protein WDZ82_00495, partial [Candidatus Paceibacterota bacterium]
CSVRPQAPKQAAARRFLCIWRKGALLRLCADEKGGDVSHGVIASTTGEPRGGTQYFRSEAHENIDVS